MLSNRMGLKHLLERRMDPQGMADYSSRNGGSCGSNGAWKRADSTKGFMLFPLLYCFPVKNRILDWDILFWHCYNHPSRRLKMQHFPALKDPTNDGNTANCDDLPVWMQRMISLCTRQKESSIESLMLLRYAAGSRSGEIGWKSTHRYIGEAITLLL
jgi:hypothetical protein